MFDPTTDTFKLIDFGLSKKLIVPFKQGVGTPYYVAPEILEREYGLEVDVWALGILCFRMLGGVFPFEGESR